ncbi:MAG TPA: hypothetical protein VJO35_00375 [Terriglobales bacterium]|nr:hypothetical protein [Terriglobales bacterium]
MQHSFRLSILSTILCAVVVSAGCSINVKKNDDGDDKKVDIDTPFGGIHVSKGADVRDTGLSVYPGSQLKQKDSGEDKDANVNISTSAFGLKVVALEYQTSDSSDKVISYYKNELKKYGNVLECHTRGHGSYTANNPDKGDSEELKCEGDNNGKTIELKAGRKSDQHIVAIDPQDKGSDFALVYVRMRGKEGTI